MSALELIADAAQRPLDAARAALEGASADTLNEMPRGELNSMSWLVWHAARQQDAQVAELRGAEQVWRSGGWCERFGLDRPCEDFGFGDDPQAVASVRVDGPELLLGYLEAVTDTTAEYVRSLSDAELDEVIDDSWDPPVTRGVRIVSAIDDAAQHVGQAAYVRGLVEHDWSGKY